MELKITNKNEIEVIMKKKWNDVKVWEKLKFRWTNNPKEGQGQKMEIMIRKLGQCHYQSHPSSKNVLKCEKLIMWNLGEM